jgi:tagaturonate reductase
MRDGEPYCIKDDREVLEFFASACNRKVEQFVQAYLSNESFHGQDLTALPGLSERVTEYLGWIRDNGMRKALEMLG